MAGDQIIGLVTSVWLRRIICYVQFRQPNALHRSLHENLLFHCSAGRQRIQSSVFIVLPVAEVSKFSVSYIFHSSDSAQRI